MRRVARTGQKRRMALLTIWRLNSLTMKAYTVFSQMFGPWAASSMRWQQVCLPSKPVASSNSSLRSRAGLTNQSPMLQPYSPIFWAGCSKKTQLSAFLGNISESIHFGRKRSMGANCLGSPHLMNTYASSEMSIRTPSLNNRLLKATLSQILRTLSSRDVLMRFDYHSVLRRT